MKSNLNLLILFIAAIFWLPAYALSPDRNVWEIDTTQVGDLNLSVNSTLFFQDNEFSTPHMRGYTLPGFRLRPSVGYQPNKYVNVELGLYMLRFWGADEYPNMAYSDIAYWTGSDNSTKGFHLLPFFRVQMATEGGLNFVLGSIYGGRYHRLLKPLYATELDFTADPEAGVQVLYSNRWLDFDAWVNWESFIYKQDTHQEAFTFGLSSRLKYNREEARVHVYSPVQALFQHRGGEIDTLLHNSVQTLFNAAAGVGAKVNINHRAVRSLMIEADILAYNQQVGNIWPIDHGWSMYVHGALDIANVRLKAGYARSDNFVSLFGYPFFGNLSVRDNGMSFDSASTLYASIDYTHEFAPGYMLGARATVYRHFPTTGYIDGEPQPFGASTSFYGALYFRLSPSFLLKKLK